jgi:Amt family ammonium transporter
VHGVGAPPGTILAGIFCSTQLGIFSGNGSSDGVSSTGGQLGIQAMCVLATALYTLVASFIILKVVDAPVGLRVNEEEETRGLDMVLHDERGYDL